MVIYPTEFGRPARPWANPKLGVTWKSQLYFEDTCSHVIAGPIVPAATSLLVFSQMACASSGLPFLPIKRTLSIILRERGMRSEKNSSALMTGGTSKSSKKGEHWALPVMLMPLRQSSGTSLSSIPRSSWSLLIRTVQGAVPSLTAVHEA